MSTYCPWAQVGIAPALGPVFQKAFLWPSSGYVPCSEESRPPLPIPQTPSRLYSTYLGILCAKGPKPTSRAHMDLFPGFALPRVDHITHIHIPRPRGWPRSGCWQETVNRIGLCRQEGPHACKGVPLQQKMVSEAGKEVDPKRCLPPQYHILLWNPENFKQNPNLNSNSNQIPDHCVYICQGRRIEYILIVVSLFKSYISNI